MENIFMQNPSHSSFSWENLGDIKEGRTSLGEEMPVLVYRLMQFTMLDTLTKEFGREKANDLIRESGRLAGTEYAKNTLALDVSFDDFVSSLQKSLLELKIGILRIEEINAEAEEIILTVSEDLDCSGLPLTNETICDYDEGFISGILEVYTGRIYSVKEIDCWASGDRTCRFQAKTVK